MNLPGNVDWRRWGRRLMWSAAGLLVFWLVAWLLVPVVLKSQVEKAATRELGRRVTLGAIDFKPWSLELTVNDLAVASQDGARDQLRIRRLYLNAELESLLRMAPVLDAIEIDDPNLHLLRTGPGRYDVDDILLRLTGTQPAPSAEPASFALFNLRLSRGSVTFDDRPAGVTHRVSGIDVSVPFISNLKSLREVRVEPRLAFELNGSRFDSAAQALPFASTHRGDASLQIRQLDLAPYLVYLPHSLPVRPGSGVIDARLKLSFEQAAQPRLVLSGELGLQRASLVAHDGSSLLELKSMEVRIADLQPLERLAKIDRVAFDGLQAWLRQSADGSLNWAVPGPAGSDGAQVPRPAPAADATATRTGWQVDLRALQVANLALGWEDRGTTPAARVSVTHADLEIADLHYPFVEPMRVRASALVGKASMTLAALATDRKATVTASLAGLPVEMLGPYLSRYIQPQVKGRADASAVVQWERAPAAGQQDRLIVQVPRFSLQGAGLVGSDAKSLASVDRVEISRAEMDLSARRLKIGAVSVNEPRLPVSRDARGRWMYEDWLSPQPASVAAPAATPGDPARPWAWHVGEIGLKGGLVAWSDQVPARAVELSLSGLEVEVRDIDAAGSRPMTTRLAANITGGRLEPGRIDWRGRVSASPLSAHGDLQFERVPVHAFEPYFADHLNVEILRAEASFKGQVQYDARAGGAQLAVRGDASLDELRVNSLVPAEELLNWKSLGLRGLDVALSPEAAPRVRVDQTVLADFYARLIVTPQGRFNLQELVRSGTATVAPTASSTAAVHASQASTPTVAPVAAAPPQISFGPMSLVNGRILFSDRFIKPNYSADLTELTGRLSAFSSQAVGSSVQMADLELRGRAEGTAALEILGQINPLARPLALDIKGKVRELELPPLSPYSIKYAGHGIDRGKLSVDVAYRVQPDGQLVATNNIVLNQLTFGDRVEGGPSLPVKLAVALLKDRNGVIDINLPVSGSLNDPQFSVGPIIFRLIFNLIAKAVTAPFSLLAAAFGGGGEEMNLVAFAAGTAELDDGARQRLDAVAKALTDRPALKLTAVGTASVDQERDAFKRARLAEQLRAEKRRQQVKAGETATAVVGVTQTEYPVLLKEVYRRADIPKPRNVIGMLKDLPVGEMEALLLADIRVDDDAMRQLAIRRAVVVKDYLAAKDLALDRLFLGAPRIVPPESKWSPRTELSLEPR